MRTIFSGPLMGFVTVVALLVALAVGVGLTPLAWAVGIASGLAVMAALSSAVTRAGGVPLGPADRVTLSRAVLTCGIAALVADVPHGATRGVLVGLALVALVLDNVDGRVARRTRTVSDRGARFDMEVDAFLILVLCVDVSRSVGAWVLAIGAARYAFLAAARVLPWMRASVPPRYWRKTVAAIQGVVLAVVASDLVPPAVAGSALLVSLALLMESFGRDVLWLWRVRRTTTGSSRSFAPPAQTHDCLVGELSRG